MIGQLFYQRIILSDLQRHDQTWSRFQGGPVPKKTLHLMRFRQQLLFLFHENREVGLGGTRLPQCLIMKRKIHGMRTATNRWIRYGILIVGVQKDSRAFTPRLWTRLLSSRNRATNCVRAKKLENRLFFFFIGHGAHAIIATTHSFDANKGNYLIRIHAKIKYQIRVINVCTKYFEQKCTFLNVFTRMVSGHANLLTQKKVYIRIRFNSHRNRLGLHQHDRCFVVIGGR